MKKTIYILTLILLISISLTACSKKVASNDKYFYYNDISKENFELISKGEKIEGSSDYMSIGRYIYEIDSKVYPDDKDYSLEIPFYIPEDTDKIMGLRSNAPFTYKKSLDGFAYRLTVDYKGIEIDAESGNRELAFEFISNDYIANDIDESVLISKMYSDGNKYENYLKIPIEEPIQKLADDIRKSLPKEEEDNLRSLSYAYVNWILENMHYPIETEKYTSRYNNLNNSVMTLDIKLGNCDDFSVLLSELLVSQGISARKTYGFYPKAFNETQNTLDDYGRHMLVEVYDGDKWITLESTVFDASNPIDFEIYGNTIKVARGLKIDTVKVQPFLPDGVCNYQSSDPASAPGIDIIEIDFIPMYN